MPQCTIQVAGKDGEWSKREAEQLEDKGAGSGKWR